MPILDHLSELRVRVFKVAIAVLVGAVVAFIARDWLFDILVRPFERATGDESLAYFEVTEAFSVTMKISLFGGLVLSSPVWSYQAWSFVSPGLHRREKLWAVPVILTLVLLFLAGVGVAYWSLERALNWLFDFGGDRLVQVIGVSRYIDFTLRYVLAFGLAFEFPVFLFAAAAVGAVDSDKLKRGRRWAVLIIVVVAAVITPGGDPLTLLLLSVPLYILYEITLLLIRVVLRK